MAKITNDIYYVGANSYSVDLFEGQFKVPKGMAYNSYIIMDEKTAVFDTNGSATSKRLWATKSRTT